MNGNTLPYPQLYRRLGLTPIPLKPRSKKPLVKWGDGWNPTPEELEAWASQPDINWAVRCGANLAVLDFDNPDNFHRFLTTHPELSACPTVNTGRGAHLWVKPRRAIPSQRLDGVEVKCLGSYVVAPPSIHPSGVPYTFAVAPDGAAPEVDLQKLLGIGRIDSYGRLGQYESIRQAAPSDFALRYGKSPYPRSLCGLATKVLTRSDGKVRHLVSLRDWKWDCPKCAPLLKRYWLEKLWGLPFRFIFRLPTVAKPTTFLRRVGKPAYVHIVANGASWLFLDDGDGEKVWAEARQAGYELVAGDVVGVPTPEEISKCLEEALCREEEPLNTRRKITHSRGLLKKDVRTNGNDESKPQRDCSEGEDDMKVAVGKEPVSWEADIVMKPIEEVAKDLEAQGWHILWQSEVEAIAIKAKTIEDGDLDIVELIENLGVKLKKNGKEYTGLCPFHDDHKPSLSVNREKGLWHCFTCGKAGNSYRFVTEWQALRH